MALTIADLGTPEHPADPKNILTVGNDAVQIYQGWLNNSVGHNRYVLDEIGLMAADDGAMLRMVKAMTADPMIRLFNSTTDRVHTGPLRSEYKIQFEFLSSVYFPWRLEVFAIESGWSPIHEHRKHIAYEWGDRSKIDAVGGGLFGFLHTSFKVSAADGCDNSYEDAVAEVCEAGWEPVQRCISRYGPYLYLLPSPNFPGFSTSPALFLKVRLNLRDSELD